MGCFPEYSKVSIAGGTKPIQEVKVGDFVLYPEAADKFAENEVIDVLTSYEELISLLTSVGAILTTASQVFPCYDGKERLASELASHLIGYVWEGKEVVYTEVKAVFSRPDMGKFKVFHLKLKNPPHFYIVENFIVRNKGGGGSSTSSTEASIAPELRPLFKQTGDILQRAQMFQPRFAVNPFLSQAYSFPFPTSATNFMPSVGGGVLGAGGVPELPPIDMVQGADGTFAAAPSAAPASDPGASTGHYVWNSSPSRLLTMGELPGEIDRLNALVREGTPGAQEGLDALRFDFPEHFVPGVQTAVPRVASAPGAGGGGNLPPLASGPPGLPGSILDEFLFPQPQFIPQATPGQLSILERQRQRAFGPMMTAEEAQAAEIARRFGQLRGPEREALNIASELPSLRPEEIEAARLGRSFGRLTPAEAAALGLSTTFGEFRSPELTALEQVQRFAGGEIGEAPATKAAMAAVREPVLNELAMAGLGNSGAVGTELGGAFAPILAKELEIRSSTIPVLAQMGEALRRGDMNSAAMFQRAGEAQRAGNVQEADNLIKIGNSARQGSIAAANLQAQIGAALRQGDVQTANFLAQQGATLVERESKLLSEAGASEEAVRQLAAQQYEALQLDMLRRQENARAMTTGILGNFPSVTGQSTVTRSKQSGGGGLGK